MSDFIGQSDTYQSLRRTNCIAMILEDDVAEADRIGWRIEQASPDPNNPLIEPAFPWDSGVVFSHGTVLKDPIDDLWKAWYSCAPFGTHHWRLAYATSEDGVTWTRPALDLCPYPDHGGTNVLIDADAGGINLYASVMVDPSADPDRRYEMYLMRLPAYGFNRRESPWLQPEIVIDGLPLPAGESSHPPGMYRYVSPDGIRWTPEAGPILVLQHQPRNVNYRSTLDTADGAFIYRDPDGGYLAYHKISEPMHPGGLAPYDVGSPRRRIIVRRTSEDGLEFSPHEVVLAPDWRDPQDLQFMELTSTPVEGGYLGIATCYHPLTQTIDLQFAGSADGRHWRRPARLPCLPLAPLGDYGGGMIWPTRHLVEDGGGTFVYYGALEGLHGDASQNQPSIWQFNGAICRARWEYNRYWAAVPGPGGNIEASLTTHLLAVGGKRLSINAVTVKDGVLRAELLDSTGEPVAGFGLDDFAAWHGDAKSAQLRWTGGNRCPVEAAAVRFHLRRARLYGFAWT